jgi:hypothetical protein
MNNLITMTKKTVASAMVLVALVAAVAPAVVTAAPIQYNPGGTGTSATPVFNTFYDVPNGVGNEADFVRLKTQAGANSTYINALSSACNVGDAFTVRTYVHNGADPSLNGNGAGSAVARKVVLAQKAELETPKSSFKFSSTISSSNAASVSDDATLNCGTKTVKLTLIPSSVKTYSKTLNFQAASDASVNGNLQLGSRAQGSGDVWACWDDRVTVTYEVKVVEVPKVVEVAPVCEALTVVKKDGRKVTVDVKYAANSATFKNVKVDFGNGVVKTYTSFPAEYTYEKDGSYTIKAAVVTNKGEVVSNECTKTVVFTAPGAPTPTPTPVPVAAPVAQPTALPEVGAGNIAALFSIVTVAATAGYRVFLGRKLAN